MQETEIERLALGLFGIFLILFIQGLYYSILRSAYLVMFRRKDIVKVKVLIYLVGVTYWIVLGLLLLGCLLGLLFYPMEHIDPSSRW